MPPQRRRSPEQAPADSGCVEPDGTSKCSSEVAVPERGIATPAAAVTHDSTKTLRILLGFVLLCAARKSVEMTLRGLLDLSAGSDREREPHQERRPGDPQRGRDDVER